MRRQDKMPARNKKNFRPTEKGAGMTRAGGAAYRRANPGSKLKTAVTGKVKPGSKAGGGVAEAARKLRAQGLMGGGMAMPRAMYGKGGGVCKRGMNRQAIGKNS